MIKRTRKSRNNLLSLVKNIKLPIMPIRLNFPKLKGLRGTKNVPEVGATQKEGNKLTNYIILALIVFFSISLLRNISNVREVEKKISDKEAKVEKLKQEQAELEKQLEYTKSQEFIEKQLRDKLGMAKEGEIVVVLPPPEVVRKFAPKREEEQILLPDPNWKKWMKLFI